MAEENKGSSTDPVLDPSADKVELSNMPPEAQARINGLMASFHKEQTAKAAAEAEVARLQGVLTTLTTSEADLKAQIEELKKGPTAEVTEAQSRATVAESKVAELAKQLDATNAELTKLRFLVKNPDLMLYSAILPETTDESKLEATVAAIRQARDAENTAVKNHLLQPGRGGQVPRAGGAKMSPAEIKRYLDSSPPGEYEKRLAEVRAQY